MVKLPQILPLGRAYSYNNSGFALAGRIIEVVTGQPYEAALTEMLFRPLGMSNTIIYPTDVLTRRFAVGHHVWDNGLSVHEPWHVPRCSGPFQGVAASLGDMLRYLSFQLGDGTAPDGRRLLENATLRDMQTPCADGICEKRRGLAWQIREIGGEWVVEHGGGINRQVSFVSLVPSRGFGLVVLTNANRGGYITDRTMKQALQEYLGIVQPEVEPRDLSVADLAPYVERYDTALANCELRPRGGGLSLYVEFKRGFPSAGSPIPPEPPPTSLAFHASDRVVDLEPPFHERGDFLRDAAGRITHFRFGGRAIKRTEE